MELEDIPNSKDRVVSLSIVSLVIITIVLTGIVLFAKNRVDKSRRTVSGTVPVSNGTAITPRESTLNGKLGLTLKGATGSYRKGDTVTLFVYGDAKDAKITGYDAILVYDPKKLRYEKVTSSLEGMDVFLTDSDNTTGMRELLITGIRNAARKDPFTLANTAMAEATFTVVDSGPTKISIGFEPGNSTDSNLMDDQNKDILGSVEGIDVSIR